MPNTTDETTQFLVQIPIALLGEVDLKLYDPVSNKITYGARSHLVVELLRRWVRDTQPATPTPKETTS